MSTRAPQVRNDMYLPAMPDMLRAPAQSAAPPRYSQRENNGLKQNAVKQTQLPQEVAQTSVKAPSGQQATRLTIPAPEDLGLAQGTGTTTGPLNSGHDNWASARLRLDQLGAVFYRLEKTPDGNFRFICAVPSAGSLGQEHQFEATATAEGEAIRETLKQVEHWVQSR